MNFLKQLFGFRPVKAQNSSNIHSQLSPATSTQSAGSAASLASTRRKLLRLSLRNTLNRNGIPLAWIGAEMFRATTPGRQPGVHLRLLINHWDPRLLTHAVALQNSLIVRLLAFDPLASNWLMGISWQFALADESKCPPMPHPGSWTADAEPDAAMGEGLQPEIAAASGPPDDVKSDLERLFAVRDAEHKQHAERGGAGGAEPTRPLFLKTQPMGLGDPEPDDPPPGLPRS